MSLFLPLARAARSAGGDPRRALLDDAARRLAWLAVLTAVVLGLAMPPSIPRWYFFHQDAALLAVTILGLVCLGRLAARLPAGPVPALTRPQTAGLIVVAALVVYGGCSLVLERFALSRDEQLAEFAAAYLGQGRLARPIPPGLAPLGEGLMPLWADTMTAQGWWLSNYLPLASLLRAVAGWAGDRWLAGPALLALGAASLWATARRLWPERGEAPTVALVLLLTSAQVIVTAMSAYAMTAHLALNALWLWCFARGGKAGHGAAMALSVVATGLHQVQPHLLFAAGFVVWLARCRRYRLAMAYAAVAVACVLLWKGVYPHLLHRVLLADAVAGSPAPLPSAPALVGIWTQSLLPRLVEYQPLNSLARFAAWQNVLLVPLAAWGARDVRDAEGRPTLMWGVRLSCALGLVPLLYQGQGFGYRYLHGLLPALCLLAAHGWSRWNARHPDRRFGAGLLWGGAALALLVTLPMAAWLSHCLLHPYAAAYRLAKAAPADVVLVDARGVAFAQDLVRIDDTLSRPLLLDLAVLPRDVLVDLCRRDRVMILDARQLRPLGLLPPMGIEEPGFAFASRRALLANLRCGAPVPMPATD